MSQISVFIAYLCFSVDMRHYIAVGGKNES